MLFKEYLLKEIAEIKNGYPFNSKDYSENGIPIVRITNIEKEVSLTNCLHVTNINKKMEEALIKENSLLIALSGSVGKMGIFKNSERAYLNQRICMVYPKVNYLRQEYLNYFFETLKKEIIRNSYGGTQVNISSKWIESLKIKIPTIAAQDKVTKNLGTIQEIIKDKKIQIEKLNELTKSLFRNMFGDPLLPRKEWEFLKMSEVGKIISGATPRTNIEEYWNGTHLWITPAEIKEGDNYLYSTERRITEKAIRNTNLELLPIGTVLLSSRAPIGKVAIVGKEMFCNQGFKNIVPNGKINSIYLYSLLKEKNEYLQFLGRGATFKEISKEILGNIKIKIPPIELQNKFAERVGKIEKLKFEIKKSIEELENLYDSLMDKYFN